MDDLLTVKNLCIDFQTDKGRLRAVDNLGFSVGEGETLGIVGESGCGKTVTALSVLGLIPTPPGKISGSIVHKGRELVGLSEREYRQVRGKEISMIFQEPMTALNPVFSIGNQMVDVLCQHQKLSRKQARSRAIEMLATVHIPSPEKRIDEYPHQLSGGMRQRVMIAMALSCRPSLLIADEPTTALDVTTQAQVMEEIKSLQKQFGMALILVTHDMGVVAETCKRVIVMYCGEIVETAPVAELFAKPRHPYTKGLLQSIPTIREKKLARLPIIEGMVPDLSALPPGCRFAPRCPKAQDNCRVARPTLTAIQTTRTACFYPEL